ncbi:MAG TPA: winged helix-turn-helix domain-containing protein [Gammaproteobacteria bacterium]
MNLLYASEGAADNWLINGLRQAHHGVTLARGLTDTLHKLEGYSPDLVVLDKIEDSSTWLTRLKAAAPGIGRAVLTEEGIRTGTDSLPPGADLQLQRPIDSTELAAHLEALLVRLVPRPSPTGIILLPHQRAARIGEAVVALTAQEFQLLAQLLRQPDRPLSTEELCRRLWKDERGTSAAALRLLIYRLRAKFRKNAGKPLIHSRPRLGYSLDI